MQFSVSDLYPRTNTSLSNRHARLKEETEFISNEQPAGQDLEAAKHKDIHAVYETEEVTQV